MSSTPIISEASTSGSSAPIAASDALASQPEHTENVEAPPPLSKNAQKRLAKAAFFQEKKLERRQREKAAKKEKKRERREHIAAGEIDEDEDEESSKKRRRLNVPVIPFKGRIVVDLGFDDMMIEKEVNSLSSQLAYCYSANRHAIRPFESVLFTSLNGRLRTRMDSDNNGSYKRWTNCEWWEEGYERLWTDDPPSESNTSADEDKTCSQEDLKKSRSEKDAVIYLTADADDELEELKEGETYILGGIVDHNRYKFLCQKKAIASGVRTARLPIGKYLADMTTRKVLTVNQVFEILVHWAESRNWEEALHSVMPKRKFVQQPSKSQTPDIKTVDLDEVEAAEEENEVEAPTSDELLKASEETKA